MNEKIKKGKLVLREYVRRAFQLGPAFRDLGIELHLICGECKGEVSFTGETTVDDESTISLPQNPADEKGIKVVCDCTERGIWGK